MSVCIGKLSGYFLITHFQERDPFNEDPNAEVLIGSVKVWLQSLAYNIEIQEQLEVTNFKVSHATKWTLRVFVRMPVHFEQVTEHA